MREDQSPSNTTPLLTMIDGDGNRRGFLTAVRRQALQCLLGLGVATTIFFVALGRNYNCRPEALAGVTPPFDGQLIPSNVTLVERRGWFQLSKLVDVYDANDNSHLGYFYDMQLLLFLRFGFSDAQDRIWFEARFASFWSRFKWSIEYQLRRCDEEAWDSSRPTMGTYDIREDIWAKSWFCWTNCKREFDVGRLPESGDLSSAAPPVRAVFDSQLNMVFLKWRHAWFLHLISAGGDPLAEAEQKFFLGGKLGLSLLSRWNVVIHEEQARRAGIPNWVVGFMAALDDIEETDEEK